MRLFVPLTRDEFDRLQALAQRERRRPQEQAAVLLSCFLDSSRASPESSQGNRSGTVPTQHSQREEVKA